MLHSHPSDLALPQLESKCREETDNYRKGRSSDPWFCLEIFRRAVESFHARAQAAGSSAPYDADDSARETLYRLYTPFIEACISRTALLTLSVSRDDIVQDVWLFFWRAAQKGLEFPSLPQALGYLQQTVRTAVLQALRKERGRTREALPNDTETEQEVSDPTADPFIQTQRRIFLERVQSVLGRTALEYRIFWLRYQMGVPPREIAPMLARENALINGQSPTASSVSHLLNQSMKRLAEDSVIRDLLKND
jgi:RNA polymerase sigma factor (sigma-70 family)